MSKSPCHAIPQSKKSETPSNIIFFDSESRVETEITPENIESILNNTNVEKEHDLYLICATFMRKDKKGEYVGRDKKYHVGADAEQESEGINFQNQFWCDVDSFTKVGKKVYIFAHNARYDVQVTGGISYLVDLGYTVESFSDYSPYFLCMTQKKCPQCGSFSLEEDDKTYWCDDCGLRFLSKHVQTKNITILSSTNYYQFALKNLGECFNLPKLEAPNFKTATIEESIIYCKRDVEILKVAMLSFIKFIKDEDLGSFKMTVAGQAFSAFRHKFMLENQIFVHRTKEAVIVERGAYAGGRNEVWKLGKIEEDVYYVDINSMYPYVMKTKLYPTKMVNYKYHCKPKHLEYYINEGYLVTAKVTLQTKRRCFFQKEKRLLFPTGLVKTFLSTPELIDAIKHKEIIEVSECCVYEKGDLFSEFVNYFYTKRLEAKAQNDEVRTLLYKIILNSLYGKFGQKNNNWELIGRADPKEVRTETIFRKGERFTVKVFGGGVFEKVELPDGEGEAPNSFPAIAAHVTAYARMLLWDCIQIAGEENTYYMDTDSLFVNFAGYKNLEAAGMLSETELGKMKLEYLARNVEIRGCKDYKMDYEKKGKTFNVDKIKGVSKSSVKIDDKTYASVVWGGLAQYIKSGNLEGYKTSVMLKTLSRAYTKGIIYEDGTVRPFVYNSEGNILETEHKKEIEIKKHELKVLSETLKTEYNIVRKIIIEQCKGLKPESNGAYSEELKNRFRYPIRNFATGTTIDLAVNVVNDAIGSSYNANELLDVLENNNQKIKNEIKKLKKELEELKNIKEIGRIKDT
jgi:DNA-directed RNA polymerase subunit RPC12/RpoP